MSTPLGIIAGAGELPLLLAKSQQQKGRAVFVIAAKNGCVAALSRYPHAWCAPTAPGRAITLLKKAGCREAVMIGSLTRPRLVPQNFDWPGTQLALKLLVQKQLGDDKLLRHVVALFERKGIRIRAIQEFLPDLMADAGYMTRARASARARADITLGVDVVRKIGAMDIGQAAVVCRGHVLAVEGVDGTDALLRRIARLPPHVRGTEEKRAGVLIKLPKPGQELRVDLPTLGPMSMGLVAKAGLAGIACAAGKTLIIRKTECQRRADAAGLFVYGLHKARFQMS